MYKYSKDHKYFRSEKHLARDLSLVLSTPFAHKTKVVFLNSLLWGWSERFGKYKNIQCSVAAKRHLRKKGLKDLRHDHAIPRNLLVKKLLGLKKPLSAAQAFRFLKKYCVATVITKEEDGRLSMAGLRQKMPEGWNWKDQHARYRVAGIRLAT